MRATDAAGNLGAYSNIASATHARPRHARRRRRPAGLAATAPSRQPQINLTWTAATDNVGVTGYRVERCQGAGCATFAQVGTRAATTFSDTGLTASTSYSYRVRATDAAGNIGAYSNMASATTRGAADRARFVQGNAAVPQSPQTTVIVTFAGAQTAGNLNVVVVGLERHGLARQRR